MKRLICLALCLAALAGCVPGQSLEQGSYALGQRPQPSDLGSGRQSRFR